MYIWNGRDADAKCRRGCFLLPALPDAWENEGSISGLRAIGGFEIVSMDWKKGKVTKVVVKSALGGNLRLRVPNTLKMISGILKKANGENVNPFYQVSAVPDPIISPKTTLAQPALKTTMLYDIATAPGKTYTLIAQ